MKKFVALLSGCLLTMASFGQSAPSAELEIALIPEPVSLSRQEGRFRLPPSVVIQAENNPELKSTVDFLSARLSVPTGYAVSVSPSEATASIRLQLNRSAHAALGQEGYQLSVTS